MLRKFLSLATDQHAYAYDTDWRSEDAQVDRRFRMFQTLGDGLIQHSGDWPITTAYATDYFASLAVQLQIDEPLAQEARFYLSPIAQGPKASKIAFCAGVIFKPGEGSTSYEKKTRYVSVELEKVTTNREKEHDKRYTTVCSSHTGTPEAIYRMLLPEYPTGLDRYLYAQAIHQWANSQASSYMELPGCFLKWCEHTDDARRLRDAIEACQDICESYRLRDAASSRLDNYRRYIERKNKPTPDTVTEVSAKVSANG